jgi:Putative zinc-finger
MSCNNVQELISSLIDRRIAGEERENVLAHLEQCAECSERYELMESTRKTMRRMAEPRVPAALQQNLRSMASYERVRQLSRASFVSRRHRWMSQLQLAFENMMRPAFLPFAGGVLSAALSFGLLVPNLSFAHHFGEGPATQIFNMPDGVVVGASGEPPRIEPADAVMTDYETVVELTVDTTGRVTDYQVTRGQLTPDLKELIMFSNFTPATFFGRSTTAKVKVFYGKIIPGMRS